ncbi:hypothetical protein [Streptomyces sp. NPDC097619]|uniref:AMIN-like domain-containing (lipo)protein n=1 Tax=Streptomyces sp. NPDC097619 TaxID=3157228 RepID=UPI003316FB3D
MPHRSVRRRRLAALSAGVLLTAGAALAAPASAAAAAPAPERSRTATQTPQVVNARYGTHCTFDRLVIDVKGYVPPVTVTRVPELIYDGSGDKVPLPGKHFLEIRMHPAQAHDDEGHPVYTGPRLKKLTLPKLKGIALTGDYEGYVTFGAAFATKPTYTTFTLHDPERWVIDFAHPNVC